MHLASASLHKRVIIIAASPRGSNVEYVQIAMHSVPCRVPAGGVWSLVDEMIAGYMYCAAAEALLEN